MSRSTHHRFFGRCLLLLLLLAATGCPLSAWERDVDLRAGTRLYKGAAVYGWHQKLLGDVDVLGLKADLSGDAAIDDRVGMGASFFLPVTRRTTLLGGYDEFDHSGKITKTVNFRRKQYKPGARLNLQHEWLDLTGASRVRQWEGGFGDFLYGMKICRSELNLRGNDPITNAFQKAAWDTMFPIPYLGFGGGARVTAHMLILGRFKAIVLPSTGEDLFTSYDAELTGAWRMNRPTSRDEWFLTFGYRRFSVSGDAGGEHLTLRYGGPTWGIIARF